VSDLITYEEMADRVEEMLNDCYDTVQVIGYQHAQGTLLREVDPVAFDQAVYAYTDSLINDGELKETDNGYIELT